MMTRLQGFRDSGAWPVLSLGLVTKVAQKVLPWPWTQSTASQSKSEQPNVAKSPAWRKGWQLATAAVPAAPPYLCCHL